MHSISAAITVSRPSCRTRTAFETPVTPARESESRTAGAEACRSWPSTSVDSAIAVTLATASGTHRLMASTSPPRLARVPRLSHAARDHAGIREDAPAAGRSRRDQPARWLGMIETAGDELVELSSCSRRRHGSRPAATTRCSVRPTRSSSPGRPSRPRPARARRWRRSGRGRALARRPRGGGPAPRRRRRGRVGRRPADRDRAGRRRRSRRSSSARSSRISVPPSPSASCGRSAARSRPTASASSSRCRPHRTCPETVAAARSRRSARGSERLGPDERAAIEHDCSLLIGDRRAQARDRLVGAHLQHLDLGRDLVARAAPAP